ncbi:hypothetical protein R3P38DRAFT_2800516 [Favolaschia claudopus]|uniref:Uncharacterized protein n=1 Tax=Favolaschia claudopus TaxID=2862362 RepID=A0AAV9ZWY0_9AGAR
METLVSEDPPRLDITRRLISKPVSEAPEKSRWDLPGDKGVPIMFTFFTTRDSQQQKVAFSAETNETQCRRVIDIESMGIITRISYQNDPLGPILVLNDGEHKVFQLKPRVESPDDRPVWDWAKPHILAQPWYQIKLTDSGFPGQYSSTVTLNQNPIDTVDLVNTVDPDSEMSLEVVVNGQMSIPANSRPRLKWRAVEELWLILTRGEELWLILCAMLVLIETDMGRTYSMYPELKHKLLYYNPINNLINEATVE